MVTPERRIGRRVRRLIGLLTILTFFVWVRGCAFRPMTDCAGNHFNQGKNGLWLGVDWVDKPHTVSEIHVGCLSTGCDPTGMKVIQTQPNILTRCFGQMARSHAARRWQD